MVIHGMILQDPRLGQDLRNLGFKNALWRDSCHKPAVIAKHELILQR